MASTNTVVKESVVSKDKSTAPSSDVWFCMKFRTLAEICLLMPLLGLAACLIVALLFQFEHIQETACKVYNVVPSISAVTGISPGRYLWRVVIAFHMGPRLLIVVVYYNFLTSFLPLLVKEKEEWCAKLLKCCYYLQICEVGGLCAISFVHNREHYPTHEKGFILYLTSSHVSFLIVLKVYHLIWPHLNSGQRMSYYKKVFIFAFSIVCITLMGYFYYRHIIHCDSMAFSTFAFAEYFVAAANMGYYWTLVGDLPDEEIIVKKPCHSPTNLQNGHPNNTSTPSRNKKEN